MKRAALTGAFGLAAVIVACGGTSASDIDIPADAIDASSDARGGNGEAGNNPGSDGGNGNGFDGSGGSVDSGNPNPGQDSGGNVTTCPPPAGQMFNDGGMTCTGIALQGAPLKTNCHTGAAPNAGGGMIHDGLYVLDGLDYYGDATNCPVGDERIVWDICGSEWATIQESSQGIVTYDIATTLGMTPGSVSLSVTCPANPTAVQERFDATNDTLTLYIQIDNGVRLDHFKRQ